MGLTPLLAVGRYRYLHAHKPRPPERHRTMLVVALPVRGTFDFDLDGTPHQVRPGQAIRVPPGVAYSTGLAAEPRGALIWLIARVAAQPGSADLRRALGLLAADTGPLTVSGAGEVREDLERALSLAERPRDWINDALVTHTVTSAVLKAAQAFSSAEAGAAMWPHQRMAEVLAWIDEHLTDPVTPAELAALAGLSVSRFYEAFQAATGTSPKDYLLRRKTEYARDWLRRDRSVTVTAVAHSLGFSSSQRFATIFRRYHGVSPTACRTMPDERGDSL
jgi:AraC-like DNA-binding protein